MTAVTPGLFHIRTCRQASVGQQHSPRAKSASPSTNHKKTIANLLHIQYMKVQVCILYSGNSEGYTVFHSNRVDFATGSRSSVKVYLLCTACVITVEHYTKALFSKAFIKYTL